MPPRKQDVICSNSKMDESTAGSPDPFALPISELAFNIFTHLTGYLFQLYNERLVDLSNVSNLYVSTNGIIPKYIKINKSKNYLKSTCGNKLPFKNDVFVKTMET